MAEGVGDCEEESSAASDDMSGLLEELIRKLQAVVEEAAEAHQVMAALHILATLLLGSSVQRPHDGPPDASLRAMEQLAADCRKKVMAECGEEEMETTLRDAFYGSGLFVALANVLLYKVAPDWVACFSTAAQRAYFDDFFMRAGVVDAFLALVPVLNQNNFKRDLDDMSDAFASSLQAKRLFGLLFLQRSGFKDIALSFKDQGRKIGERLGSNAGGSKKRMSDLQLAKQVAQLIASIPDRVGLNAPEELSSPSYFKVVTSQMLLAAEEQWTEVSGKVVSADSDPVFSFIAETLCRICRRGHADVIASQMMPALTQHVQEISVRNSKGMGEREEAASGVKECSLDPSFWPALVACFKDSHVMERWAEALLREMRIQNVTDVQADCILRILFGAQFFRKILLEKVLFYKIFPVQCLKWFLDFAVLRPSSATRAVQEALEQVEVEKEVVKRIAHTWSQKEFIQSAQMNQQAYLTAALGLCLQGMKKEQISGSGNLIPSILQGVTNRLESPILQVRDMAARVAFAFSIALDPNCPLFIDDGDKDRDLCDWESLLPDTPKNSLKARPDSLRALPSTSAEDVLSTGNQKAAREDAAERKERKTRKEKKKLHDMREDDPDAVINFADASPLDWSDDDGSGSAISETESESSLQPYDMSDDEADLDRGKFPVQLSECASDLRKGDNPAVVEKALHVLDKLVRAIPDELESIAQDLADALVRMQCSSIAVEGEEESAESKRHHALVSLIVCSPVKTVEVMTRELFSPHVDISQRLLILEVMSDAALELASKPSAKNIPKHGDGSLVTEFLGPSDHVPWYGPGGDKGPSGSGPWMDVTYRTAGDYFVGWAPVYERELPSRGGDKKLGKTRRWGTRSMQLREERWKNKAAAAPVSKYRFADLAAMFMLPVMRFYDRKSHGVDFVNRDFIVLGRLLHMLGVCMECICWQPEAPILSASLLDMLRSRAIANHPEPFVRRAAIYAASRIIVALHPSQVVATLRAEDHAIADGLDWIREWALRIADNDPDTECATMAMVCVQLHSEMALEASRQLNSGNTSLAFQPDIRLAGTRSPLIMPL